MIYDEKHCIFSTTARTYKWLLGDRGLLVKNSVRGRPSRNSESDAGQVNLGISTSLPAQWAEIPALHAYVSWRRHTPNIHGHLCPWIS